MEVALVFSRLSFEELAKLSSQLPVWYADARNGSRAAVERVWRECPRNDLTFFNCDSTDIYGEIARLIPTLELHYPQLNCLRLLGVSNSAALAQSLAHDGYELHDGQSALVAVKKN